MSAASQAAPPVPQPGWQRSVAWILIATMLLSLAGSVLLLRYIDRLREGAALEEVLYIPSPKVLKAMSLGYTGLMADLYWTRAVQYFGAKHRARAEQYKLLAPLLDITTTLDPHLLVAYRFGATFLAQQPPDGAGDPQKAAELIERGIRANPDTWQLYFDLGFVDYLELHDPGAAAQAFQRGSRIPHAHPFLKVLAASMAQHAGELQTARILWTTTYQTSDDKMIKNNAVKHLRAIDSDEVVIRLQQVVDAYVEKTGIHPQSFLDLVRAGYVREIPLDPTGRPYRIVEDRVEVSDPNALPFITQGLPMHMRPQLLPFGKALP